jgi:hypothetical protein
MSFWSLLPGIPGAAEMPSLNLDPLNISGNSPGYRTGFREKEGAVNLTSPNAAVPDSSGEGLTEIRVFAEPILPDDILSAETAGTDLLATYEAGILHITGRNVGGWESAENYQKVLRTVVFENLSFDPDESPRTITFIPYKGESGGERIFCFLTVTAVNDPPVNTVPASQFTPRDVPLFFSPGNGNRISVSDPDAGGSEIQVEISAETGRVSVRQTSAAGISGNNTARLLIQGRLPEINEELNGLRYDPPEGWEGRTALHIVSDDLGSRGWPGPQTDSDSVSITAGVPLHPLPPVADAGADMTAEEYTVVRLDASGSYAQDSIITKYAWTPAAGMPEIEIRDADTACPSLTVPEYGLGELVIELIITDSRGLEDGDSVRIEIRKSGSSQEDSGDGDSGGCFISDTSFPEKKAAGANPL